MGRYDLYDTNTKTWSSGILPSKIGRQYGTAVGCGGFLIFAGGQVGGRRWVSPGPNGATWPSILEDFPYQRPDFDPRSAGWANPAYFVLAQRRCRHFRRGRGPVAPSGQPDRPALQPRGGLRVAGLQLLTASHPLPTAVACDLYYRVGAPYRLTGSYHPLAGASDRFAVIAGGQIPGRATVDVLDTREVSVCLC